MEEKHGELLDRFIQQLDLLLGSSATDADLDCCLDIICHIIPRIPSPSDAFVAAQKLAAALASSTQSRPDKRLQSLITLYNVVQGHQGRTTVLLTTLKYTKTSPGLADVMVNVIRKNVDDWAADLAADPPAQREMLCACADALRAAVRRPKTAAKERYRLLTRCLTTYVSPADATSGKQVAADVIKEFIASPDLYHFDLLSSPAVAQLASDNQYAPLHGLLTVYLDGGIPDYKAFISKNPKSLELCGISADQSLEKMRLLALMGLARGASHTGELSFSDLQLALEMDASDVESCIVQAIGKKIMEARIDQLRGMVEVGKCTPRMFGAEEWNELSGQLGRWRETVAQVKEFAGSEDEKDALTGGRGLAALSVKG
jgi:translation initiation factor 3 subunit M